MIINLCKMNIDASTVLAVAHGKELGGIRKKVLT